MTINPDALYQHKTSGKHYRVEKFVRVRTPDGSWVDGIEYQNIVTGLFYVCATEAFLTRLEIAATPEDSPWAQS